MTTIQALDELLASFPDEQQREVLNFARYLQVKQEHAEWQHFGAEQFARAYGSDEPEYTEADVKPRPQP